MIIRLDEIRLERNWLKLWHRVTSLPPVKGLAEGTLVLHSDGDTVRVLKLCGGAWKELATWSTEFIERYLMKVRVTRRRAERLRKQMRCKHERMKRRRCLDCGHLADPAWSRCDERPSPSTWRGERCTRRKGHDGAHRFAARLRMIGAT